MTASTKDTIYIDVDEEITGMVNKVQNSPKDIVALVLPKRASVLQSIVNMKLLKRAADQNKKKVVLITSESRILPLAGAAGLFVASNLTSKPFLPPLTKVTNSSAISDADSGEIINPDTPVSAVAPNAKFADSAEGIEIDNTPKTPESGESKAAHGGKSKKGKKLKVPNFSKFRKKLIIIGLAVLILIFGLIYGIFIAPKAKVTFRTQTSDIPLNLDFVADTNTTEFNKDNKIVRAENQQSSTNGSEKVPATGQKNKGDKANGSVTMTSKKCPGSSPGNPDDIPSGTGVSANGQTFITQKKASFTYSSFDGTCATFTSNQVNIIAQNPGEAANVDNSNFSVSGRSDVSAQGSATGGTDKIVKVVTKEDVDKAKERLNSKQNTAQDDLKNQLEKDGYIVVSDSFKAKPGAYSASPSIDDEGDEVTVSVTITYSMLGIKQDDLKELVKDQAIQQPDGKDKTVLSDGIDQAKIKLSSARGVLDKGQIAVNIETQVVAGPDINQDNIKQQIAGKKSGEAETILQGIAGIEQPKVELSPFWVGKIPKKQSKIHIEIQQADGRQIP